LFSVGLMNLLPDVVWNHINRLISPNIVKKLHERISLRILQVSPVDATPCLSHLSGIDREASVVLADKVDPCFFGHVLGGYVLEVTGTVP